MRSESVTPSSGLGGGLLVTRSETGDTSFLKSCSKKSRPNPDTRSSSPLIKYKKSRPNPNPNPNPRSCSTHPCSVDLGRLLFTPSRHFLITNNGRKVWSRDLMLRTVVLFILPIDNHMCMEPGDTLDMIQAYHELLPLGGTEFVFLPVWDGNICCWSGGVIINLEDRFNSLFSAIPFPAVPFSDIKACSGRLYEIFSDSRRFPQIAYWAIIDPTGTVVATRTQYPYLFKLFGGAELYPLSLPRIWTLLYDFEHGDHWELQFPCCYGDSRRESRKRLIRKWDQLLASPTRDFLLSSNGDRVPISSLKGKLIGLYFCENIPHPPRMEEIKKAYQDAKLCGYDFEIVQINYHYEILKARHTKAADFSKQQHYENIDWLRLPFKDPSCRILQRIFECSYDPFGSNWFGDCLVIIDSRMWADEVIFEFCGASIISRYGIEGYPFTRQALIERECRRHKRETKLQLLFPPGLCQFTKQRVGGDGFDLVNDSLLKGKRVLVLFARLHFTDFPFISTLKSKYLEQTEEDKFEVVYVSTDDRESEYIQDMPWLFHPYSQQCGKWCGRLIYANREVGAAAFDIDGQLISKGCIRTRREMKHQFPYFSPDLRCAVQEEVTLDCGLYNDDITEPRWSLNL